MYVPMPIQELCSEGNVLNLYPESLPYSGYPDLHAEQASAPRHVNLARLEEIIAEDHGKRGIAPLVIRGELARAAYHLSHDISPGAPRACQHVAILTGYPCYPGSPPTETDGPLGAIATARALVALGKTATILTDVVNEVCCVKFAVFR